MFKKYRVFIILFIVLVLFFLGWFFFFRSNIIFDVSGSIDEIIDVNDDFVPEDISACYGNKFKCKKIDVVIDSNVVPSVLGSYEVVYSAGYNKYKKSIVKKVTVIDNEPPVISSESDILSVCPNATDFDISYEAIDNYDGDLSLNVSKNVIDDSLVLSVYDSSNNLGTKSISVVREDTSSPSITLSGNTNIYVPINSTFSDPGYYAYDNCDGDITSNVKISGSVDTTRAGTYTITYDVSDNSGNSYSVSRSVSVYAQNGNSSHVIYLTFDDGPSQYTGELLDILAKYNVKVTFFVTSINSNYSNYITRAFNEGHSIALHTNTHNYSYIYSSSEAYFNDLNAVNEKVKSLTGSYSNLIRFPGGSSNTVSSKYNPGIMTYLTKEVEARGFKYFDWNVSSGDADGKTHSPSEYAKNVINSLGSGSTYIVLQHDTNINSIRAVSTIIEYGLSHGYSFQSLNVNSPTVHHKVAN